jgi:hypothetical protein
VRIFLTIKAGWAANRLSIGNVATSRPEPHERRQLRHEQKPRTANAFPHQGTGAYVVTDLDFYASAVTDGAIYGIGVDSSPEQWTAKLGDQCLDDVRKRSMRRDYGLIEVGFHRLKGEHEWRCFSISVPVHRLAWGTEKNVPDRLSRDYGPFHERLPFTVLAAEIKRHNEEFTKDKTTPTPGFDLYRLPAAKSATYVVREHGDHDGPHREGDVWSLALLTTLGPPCPSTSAA